MGDELARRARRSGALASFAIIVVIALIAADDARACLCAVAVDPVPNAGVTVPRNARVFLSVRPFEDAHNMWLKDPSADDLPFTVAHYAWGWPSLAVVVPVGLLESGQTYRFEAAGYESTSFIVSDEVDHTPPPVPLVVHVETSATVRALHESGVDCGQPEVYSARFDLEALGDAVLTLVGRLATEPFQDDLVDGVEVVSVERSRRTTYVGKGGCIGGWPDAAPGASATFFIGTLDIAGNFSGWSDPIEVTLPAVSSVTCAHTSTRNGTPWAVLALIGLAGAWSSVEKGRARSRAQMMHASRAGDRRR